MSFCDDSARPPPPPPHRRAARLEPPRDVLAVKRDIAQLAQRCIRDECTARKAVRAFFDHVDQLVPDGLPEEQVARLVIDAVATVRAADGHFAHAVEAWLHNRPYRASGFDSIVIQ